MSLNIRLIFIIACICASAGCFGATSGELVLFDFESDTELDRFHWQCHTLLSLSNEHVSHGNRSLKLQLFPSDYPGLAPMLEDKDWREYKELQFDIYNPEEKEIQIFVRIDDKDDYPDFEDRYNKGFILKPGMNRKSIPLNSLITSETGRKLNLKSIYLFLIFVKSPEGKITLYVDYLRLVS